MNLIDPFLTELDHEVAGTKKMLERIPGEHWAWKPHGKSMSLGQLASHIAETPRWVEKIFGADAFNLDLETYKPYLAFGVTDLVKTFEKNVAEAKEKMRETTDGAMMGMWRMSVNGKQMLEMPRAAVLRAFIFSHLIHHRGQLSVYLRLKDVPLPAVYGDSADEKG
jgi:uncharacterized damage-inducible protein DinB